MKNRLFSTLILCLATALTLGAACPLDNVNLSSSTPAVNRDAALPPTELKLVQDERFNFSLTVPQDWEVIRKEGNPVLFAVAPQSTSYGPMANVVVEDLNQRMAAFDYLEANILTMRISLPDLKIKRGGVELINGVSVAWLHYTYPRGQILVEAVAFCQTYDYRAYTVTTMAPAVMFREHEVILLMIGRSLRVGGVKSGG